MTGTLADTTPAGVLQVLSSQGSTGAVRFLGTSACTVYLYRGELYFAENDDTAEDLAVALVRPDRLSAEQWDGATDAGYPDDTVGERLIATGAIDRELLASVVLSVIYDPLIALFRAPVGDYEFAPDVLHWIGPYRTFDVDAVVSEVRRRTREADEMTPVVPSLDAVVRSARSLPERHGSVNLRRDDWEVVVAAAKGCTVSELAVELGRGRWSTARLVYRLATADLLTVTVADTDLGAPYAGAAEPTPGPTDPEGDDVGFAADAWDREPTPGLAPDPGLDDPWATPGEDAWDRGPDPVTDPGPDPWDAGPDHSGPDTTDPWATPLEDPFDAGTPIGFSPEPDAGHDGLLTAVPDDTPGPTENVEIPELHPDIAKALAESTYADSATAINAMAARLGAAEDDDDWGADPGSAGTDDGLWGEDPGSPPPEDFIWKPAVWDTGTETAPLPRRSGARATAQREAGDPDWLGDLYDEFMPADPSDAAPAAGVASANEAAKPRGLRRLLAAIRRL